MSRRLARLLGFLLFVVTSIVGVTDNVQAYGTGPWTNVLGPGGGTVYYYSDNGFNCGINLTQVCNYLEVAGTGWSASNRFWDSTKALNVNGTSQEIGTGAKNTSLIVAGNSTLGYAATDTNAYVSSTGLDDWFLPSLKEVQSMDNANYSTAFGEVGTSTQARSDWWHTYDSNRNFTPGDSPKREAFKVLAVRAFGKSDSSLANLQVSGETLSPSFSPTVLEYSVTTSRSTVQITPAAVGASSALVGSQSVTNGQLSSAITLANGLNQVVVRATAADGTSTSYTVNITKSIAITYDGNGSTSGSVPSSQIKTTGVALTVASNSGSLVKAGYTFAGWNTLANGLGTSYAVGASYSTEASLSLYAQWTANTLTVTYNSQSGSSITAGSTTTGSSISASPGTPTRTGYTFTGWFTATSGGTAISFPYTHGQTANFTLYAQWTVMTFAVTFNGNGNTGGSIPSAQTKTYGVALTLASNSGSLVKAGYTFAGWNTLANGLGTSYAVGASYSTEASLSLYAQWTANTLTVTYNSQSGSAITAGSTTTGGSISASPGTPTRTGYTFTGWFTATSGGTAISFPYTHGQTANFTLYAQWTVMTFAVTFDGNGNTGGSIPSAQTKTYGVALTLASNSGSLVKAGYTFAGWNTLANGLGTSYAVAASYALDASLTLFAQWSANSLTVTYDTQLGSSITAGLTTTGGSISSSPGTPTRTGYTFSGWFVASSGGAAISFPYAHGQTASFTLYAQWTANSLTVTYDSQGGSAISAGSTSTGGSISTSPGTPTRSGYTFTGWFVASTGGAAISFPYTHGQTASFTLYAQWTANSLTVTYDSQGGSAISAGSTSTGGSISTSPGTPTRTGYEFAGWFAGASGGAAISFPYTHGQTSSFTVYAQWTANALTVTTDEQGGTAIGNASTTTGGSIASSPGTPTRTGYTFTGWFVASSGGAAISFPYAHGQTASFTLYAQWTANSLVITYDSQGGSAITAGSTSTGGSISASPGTPTRSGYTFTGWFVASSGGTQISFPYTHGQTSSFTVYAQWSADSLVISYDSQLGSAILAGSTSTGGSISTSPGTPTRTGYEFAGWFAGASGGAAISFPYTHGQTSSFTLYAQWTANSLTVTTDEQGGTSIDNTSTTTGGSIASSPGTPTRSGYTFTGWFVASSGGTLITFPYAHGQTASFTLYAQWTANSLVITYDSQLGSAIAAGSTSTGGSISASSGTPTRTGYEFAGWFVASSGGTQILFPYTHGQTSSFTLYAQWSVGSLTVAYDSQGGSAITAGSTTTNGSISASPGTPTRTGYTFTGWFAAISGGTQISFPYTHGQTSSFTLYAQWAQSSLYGLGSKTKIGTITTADGVGNTFAAETATSSVSLRYPADGLPAGTVIDVYLVNDLTRANNLIAQDGGFVISLVVAWLAADSSVPLTASGKPISMTIANTSIKAGAKTYAIVGGVVTLIGTAASDGTVTVSISEDPEIVVVNPVAEVPPSNNPTTEPVANPVSKPTASSPAASPVVPVVTPIVKIPTQIKNLVPVIPGAPSKISGILNPSKNGTVVTPKVITPVVNAKAQTQRATIAPVQLRAVPIDAPAAPAGAKIVPIGSMIVASKEAPKEAESQVSTGEAKATFGGQEIVSTIQKSSDGVVLVSSGPSKIALAGFTSNTSAELATSSSVPLEIATSSFIASTPVQVWLFSTPILLAETIVDSDGNFAVAINIPSSIPSGNHTLQIQGYAYTSSGAAEITSNIGISIAQLVGKTWSITFPQYVASISKNSQVAWTNFASGQGASVLSCSLTGVSPSKNSKANIKLFENRQTSLLTMLKYNGCVNVNINAPLATTKSATLDRTWKVDVQPATSSVAFKWSHEFKIYSSAIDRKQIPQWSALVAQNESSNLACSVTGAEPLAKSKANTRLFDKRNESLRQYLLSAGCTSVQFESPISRSEKLASRTIWKVEVKTLN